MHVQLFASLAFDREYTGYPLICCSTCGFVFADIAEKQEVIDLAYRVVGRPTDRIFDLERLESTAEYLAVRIDAKARVLDAGCGTGALLTYLRARGIADVFGLDASPAAIEALRSRGLEGTVGSLAAPPAIGTFDIIVLAHVLEHVRDLHSVFAALRKMLRPSGIVYAEVPDATKYVDALFEPFHDINTEHINHFSPQALARLFRAHGFETIDAGDKWIKCSPDIPYPATYGLWKSTESLSSNELVERDDDLEVSVARYIDSSTELLHTLAEKLAVDLRAHENIAIWGAGEFSQRLAWDTRFAGKTIVAVVDGSPQRQGRFFKGVPIEPPDALRKFPNIPIVVCSILQRDDIVNAYSGLGLSNDVIMLHLPR